MLLILEPNDFIIIGGIVFVIARSLFLSNLLLGYFKGVPARLPPLEEINKLPKTETSRREQLELRVSLMQDFPLEGVSVEGRLLASRIIRIMLYSYFFHQLSILGPKDVFVFPLTITFTKLQFQFLFSKFGLPPYFISSEKFKLVGRFFYELKNHSIQISNDQTSNNLLWCH